MGERADRLRTVGDVSARGELRVDEERAREKLQKFRLANPHFYVLQFVRTASLLGATQIDFDIDADEVKCTFDAAIPSEYLEDFWSRAYGNRRDDVDEALYHLALGLGSAQALEPGFIYVETTDGGGFALILEGRTERVSPTGTVSSRDTTQIYVREKFRFGHLVEFFTSRLGELEEVRAIRERCRFATLRIRVNGAPTSLPGVPSRTGVSRAERRRRRATPLRGRPAAKFRAHQGAGSVPRDRDVSLRRGR